MFEPVTMTRAASAAAGGGAAPMSVDSGWRFWANAFDAIMRGIPTQAPRVMRRNPNLQSPILIMGFSFCLVGSYVRYRPYRKSDRGLFLGSQKAISAVKHKRYVLSHILIVSFAYSRSLTRCGRFLRTSLT